MEIQELARQLAEEMGRTPSEGLSRSARRAAYLGLLRENGLTDDASPLAPILYRLEDMIDNLCAEAWEDWDRKQKTASSHPWKVVISIAEHADWLLSDIGVGHTHCHPELGQDVTARRIT